MTVIEIKPSRLLLVLVTGLHVVAAFSLWFSVVPLVGWVGLALVLASWGRFLAVRTASSGRIGLAIEGELLLDPDGAAEARLRLAPETTVAPFAVWLVWPREEGRRGGAQLVMRDQASARDWRELQVWARLRAGHAVRDDAGRA